MTKIEWTQATWNPLVGCSIVSPGCTNCYAMKMAARIERMLPSLEHYEALTKPSKAGPVWTGKVMPAPDHILMEPLKRRKPTLYFVNSMSDLFHEDVPTAWIDRVFAVMAACPQHTFQVLTKRAAHMRNYMGSHDIGARWAFRWLEIMGQPMPHPDEAVEWTRRGLPNVWLGVSCEDQRRADERVPHLLATPAAVRFVSAEPLLGPIDFTSMRRTSGEGFMRPLDGRFRTLDWIIVGGESGPGARPMHPDWARSIRDQCEHAGTAFFFKQWGAWAPEQRHPVPYEAGTLTRMTTVACTDRRQIGSHSYMAGRGLDKDCEILRATSKKRNGRLLDGREHNDMPQAASKVTVPA